MTSQLPPSTAPTPHHHATAPSLCDALLDLQMGHAGATGRQLRQAAESARLLQSTLRPVARALEAQFRGAFTGDDLLQTLLAKLAQQGPMRGRANAPTTDEEALRLLRRSLHNQAIDMQRAAKRRQLGRHVSLTAGDDDHRPVDPESDAPGADEALETTERERDEASQIDAADGTLDAIEARLCKTRDARRSGTGNELRRQLGQLRQAAAGTLDVGALAREELQESGGDARDTKALAKARNAIDARFKRCRAAMVEALDAWLAEQRPDARHAELLRLRLRRRTALQAVEAAPASDPRPPGRRLEGGHDGHDHRGRP